MKIKKITKLSEITKNTNDIKIGLFTGKSNPELLLFYSNLIDNTFSYYDLEEEIIEELSESDIVFNVLLINKVLKLESINILLKYCDKYDSKLIYAPTNSYALDSLSNLIKKCKFIIVSEQILKKSFKKLNNNILSIPHGLNEEYDFIKESGLFDDENYIEKYNLNDDASFDSILHFLTLGIYENCNPFKNLDLNNFLMAYPEINKYNINPFIYYIILNQLFKFENYSPFESMFNYPSLSRLILWDNNNDILEEINGFFENEYENDFYFEITEIDNGLIFEQQNKISHLKQDYLIDIFSKNKLMIKNRATGKRFLKEINNSVVELTGHDLIELDIVGIYDTYVQVSTLNKDFLYRINFNNQNNNKILKNKNDKRIFDSYETADNYLAFKYQRANFIVDSINVANDSENLLINGEITLFNDLDFENIELVIFLNQVGCDKQYIVCDYKKNGDTIRFNTPIDFKYYSTDLGNSFKIDVHLKNKSGVIIGSRYLRGFKLENLKDTLKKHVKKTVFFESFHGKFYSGQPKYIYEKMLEMGLNKYYDFVWAYSGELELPGNPMITARRTKNYNNLLAASDYWITNMSFPFLKPSEDIVYVHTTHGTPYKHMGSDIESNNENVTKGRVLIESGTWNYLLSSNDYAKEIFIRSFEYDGTVINKGYPANDIFYEDTTIKEQKIKEKLNLDSNKKIILYCPTFRDYDVDENNEKKFSHLVDLNKLYKNIGEDYIFIMRLHYSISKHLVISEEMENFIIDLSDYDDVANLYLISDILITDYSSAFFDFAHSKKPILFYVPDFEKYSSFRGLYSEVKENLPGPEIYTNDELINCINNINDIKKQFKDKYSSFYEKFCCLGHGTASEEVINIIFGEVCNE